LSGLTLAEFSEFLAQQGFDNEIVGDRDLRVTAVGTLDDAGPGQITFLSNPKYTGHLATTEASVVILDRTTPLPERLTAVRCDDPYAAVTAAIIRLHGHRTHPKWGIDERAAIARSASIGENSHVGPYVTVGDDVTIGRKAVIYPGCYVGDGTTLGDDVTLFPNVVIYDGSTIGNRVTIHAGSVIGQDGLGYAPHRGQWIKIPQVGRIIIEDDVEVGANCSFDRATLGVTRVGKGTKFSNNVVIGHGAVVGEHCMIVGHVGIAGSATIGNRVTLAGQVGVTGHLKIADDVKVGAQSGVNTSLKAAGEYVGSPAVDRVAFGRQVAAIKKLPDMKQRLRGLEREVAELRAAIKRKDS
jgi:UDP-3-O-[3-hydroxymyristoyl] glucosamine N-acyltransferase